MNEVRAKWRTTRATAVELEELEVEFLFMKEGRLNSQDNAEPANISF